MHFICFLFDFRGLSHVGVIKALEETGWLFVYFLFVLFLSLFVCS